MNNIRGRFAPSPTGYMHLGNAWTALLAWLEVRHLGGTMVLRVEDLDPDRSRPEYIQSLLEDLKWLGLDWDEGPDIGGSYAPYTQDERRFLYKAAIEELAGKGLLYPCYCTRAELAASAPHAGEGERVYQGTCRHKDIVKDRKSSLRVMVQPGEIPFTDGVYALQQQDVLKSVGDFVVRRSDGVHAYQLAVVVDDGAMNITHVLRGDDLLDSTARQLYLYKALGLKAPEFSHVPLLVGEDGHRLSKRHGDLTIRSLREKGVRAPIIIGYLAWQAGFTSSWQEITAKEVIKVFDLRKVPKRPIVVEAASF